MQRRLRGALLPVGILLYVACYAWWYPTFYAFQDERTYVAKANRLAHGELVRDVTDVEEAWIDKYPPGEPMLLAPLLRLGFPYVFLVGPAASILATLVLAALLRRHEIPSYFALLLLFHPTMVLYSRSLMADVPTAACFLGAVWLLLERDRPAVLGAMMLGFTVTLRVALAPFAGLFLAYVLWRRPTRPRRAGMLLGFLAGASPFLLYLQQSGMMSQYGIHDVPDFGLFNFIPHGVRYFLSLNAVYPLMFLVGVLTPVPGHAMLRALAVLAMLLFPLFTSHPGDDPLALVVLYQRYFLFLLGPLLVGYSLVLWRRLRIDARRFAVILSILVVGCAAVSARHQTELARNRRFQQAIYAATTAGSLLVVDDLTEELVQEVFGPRVSANTELLTPARLFDRIDSFAGDVFVVKLLREPDQTWPAGHRVLARYPADPATTYEDRWRLRLWKLQRP